MDARQVCVCVCVRVRTDELSATRPEYDRGEIRALARAMRPWKRERDARVVYAHVSEDHSFVLTERWFYVRGVPSMFLNDREC